MIEYVKGEFYEGQFVTVKINGKQIERRVKYCHYDGLYIIYQNRKYFQYECSYDEYYNQKG